MRVNYLDIVSTNVIPSESIRRVFLLHFSIIMSSFYNSLDVVAVIEPCGKVQQGAVGTIVEKLNKKTYLVEFSDNHGCTIALEPFSESHILKLQYNLSLVTA